MSQALPGTPALGAGTDVGRRRENNEDALGCFPERGLYLICDGMGGQAAGEVAANLAVQALDRFLDRSRLEEAGDDPGRIAALLREAARRAHQTITQAARENPAWRGMGCTLILALRRGPWLHLCNVGDSRAYLVDQGEMRLLSHDHTVAMEMVEAGLWGMEEIRASPEKHLLTQVLGQPGPIEPFLTRCRVERPSWLLLCSDGLWDMLDDQRLWEIVRQAQDAPRLCHRLIQEANQAGGLDNITVLALACGGEE